FVVAVLIEDPIPVGRPTRSEVQMIWRARHQHLVRTIDVTAKDPVRWRARNVQRDALAVRAQTNAIRETFVGLRDLLLMSAVQVHRKQTCPAALNDLDDHPLLARQNHTRSIKWRDSLRFGNLGKRAAVQIVYPDMRWDLMVVLVEGFAVRINLLHAQEDHPPAIRQE